MCPKCGPVPPPELALETEGELLRILNELNEQVRVYNEFVCLIDNCCVLVLILENFRVAFDLKNVLLSFTVELAADFVLFHTAKH